MKVFINAGHAPNGNPDPGACGFGLRESDITAKVGRLVKHYLDAIGFETQLLQSDSLYEIVQAANNQEADIFVSIHCNAADNPAAQGTETWHFFASIAGRELAGCIQKQIIDSLGTVDRGTKGAKPGTNGLYVLTNTDSVAALVELAFISNEQDAALLGDEGKQDEFARAIARGITDYLSDKEQQSQASAPVGSANDHSKYFSRDELSCHCCGELPDGGIDARLLQVLDAMRERIGKPCYISCAYRCPSHNADVGGVPNSQHVLGTAADFQLPDGWSVDELAGLAEECGADGIGKYDWGCHVDVRGCEARW